MSQESTDALSQFIEDKIDYMRQEFDMTYGEVVGVLEFVKYKMLLEAFEDAPWEKSQ